MTVTPIGAAASAGGAWATATTTNTYSEYDFHVTSQDSNGDSEHVRIKMPQWMARSLMAMVDSGDYPRYQSPSDVMRDALYHRIHWLRDNISTPVMRARMSSALDQWELEQQIIDAELGIAHAVEMTMRVTAILEQCEKYALWSKMQQTIRETRDKVQNWEGGLWSDMDRLLSSYEAKIPGEYIA